MAWCRNARSDRAVGAIRNRACVPASRTRHPGEPSTLIGKWQERITLGTAFPAACILAQEKHNERKDQTQADR